MQAVHRNHLLRRYPDGFAASWRGDIETEADLAEEVLRLNGYEHITSTLMHGVTMAGFRGQRQVLSDRIKDCMVGMGWFEIMNFSFISPRWLEKLGLEAMDKGCARWWCAIRWARIPP